VNALLGMPIHEFKSYLNFFVFVTFSGLRRRQQVDVDKCIS
jgi:hypothetical protein